jgi:hypothetical protein
MVIGLMVIGLMVTCTERSGIPPGKEATRSVSKRSISHWSLGKTVPLADS